MMLRDEILNMQPGINNVIIELDCTQDYVKLSGGKNLKLDTSWEPEKHAAITGTVLSVCKELYFNPKPGESHSLDWDTDIDILPGDYVVSYYLSAINAMAGDGRLVFDEYGARYMIIKYDKLFAARREGMVIPLNGYNLLTPIKEVELGGILGKMKKNNLHIPAQFINANSNSYARLKHVAKPIRRYRDPRYNDFTDTILPGEIAIIRKNSNIPLEYEYHATLEGKQLLYRIQRNFIYGIADESILTN